MAVLGALSEGGVPGRGPGQHSALEGGTVLRARVGPGGGCRFLLHAEPGPPTGRAASVCRRAHRLTGLAVCSRHCAPQSRCHTPRAVGRMGRGQVSHRGLLAGAHGCALTFPVRSRERPRCALPSLRHPWVRCGAWRRRPRPPGSSARARRAAGLPQAGPAHTGRRRRRGAGARPAGRKVCLAGTGRA